MKKINLKDIVSSLPVKGTKSYNTDLFKSDSENITETFNKNDYDLLILIDTNCDGVDGMLRETIIGLIGSDAYLINTQPHNYNGEITVSIFQKWLTLQGLNYFIGKTENEDLFYDNEGYLSEEIKEFYNQLLDFEGYEITYQDILELGVYNQEYKCTTLSFEIDNIKHNITINDKQLLSKITRKNSNITETKKETVKPKVKSILG